MTCQARPVIKLKEGERITRRITAKKAKNVNRDGAIHGFTLLRAKDRSPVPEWDFELKPGVQEFEVTAPSEPGEYIVVCTAEQWAGQKVKVTGTMDPKTNTITVGNIEASLPTQAARPSQISTYPRGREDLLNRLQLLPLTLEDFHDLNHNSLGLKC